MEEGVPAAKLADGASAARDAVKAAFDPDSIQYELAMMVIDMAEKQGAPEEGALKEAGTAPDGGNRVAAARKKCTDQGKWWDAKEVSKPGGIRRACKDKSKMPE